MTVARYDARDGMARWIHTAQPAAEFADRIADTEFVPVAMRGRPAMVAACIMYGDEIGVGPMQALASIHVVEGRPFPSAELLRALILRDGHTFRVTESTGTRCRVMGLRAGRPESEATYVEWTIEMARAANLAGRGAWRSYPRALLLARASTDLARMVFPDVVKGLGHVPDVPAVAEDYAELAAATGLPDDPAPAATQTVQWTPPKQAVDGPTRPPAGPDYVPWDDDATDEAKAVETPPTAEAAAPRERLTDREQVTRIMAAYSDLGYGDDRTTRLALFSALLAQPVESTNDLERMTAYRLLGLLRDVRDGRLIATADGHGGFTVNAGDEPPDDEP